MRTDFLLVNTPPLYRTDSRRHIPLGLHYLSAALKARGYSSVVDDWCSKGPFNLSVIGTRLRNYDPDVIGLSTHRI